MTTWTSTPPTTESMRAAGMKTLEERFIWVRGWDFNRPVIMQLIMGVRRTDGEGSFEPELRYGIMHTWPAANSEPVWESEFLAYLKAVQKPDGLASRGLLGKGWRPLEFGPEIEQPNASTSVCWEGMLS